VTPAWRRFWRILIAVLVGGALVTAAGVVWVNKHTPRTRYIPQEVPRVLGVQAPIMQSAIAARIDSAVKPSWVTPDRWKRVRKLYTTYENAPLWLQPDGVKERAGALLKALEAAPEHALRTDAYPIDSIRRVVLSPRIDSTATAKTLADADVLLTAAYVGYASDMLMGQVDPRSISQGWFIPARIAVVDSALSRALADTSMAEGLSAMAPQDSEYVLLKQEYAHFQKIVAAGGWAQIEHGVSPEELHKRLAVEGYLPDSVEEDSLPEFNARALKAFQERHGLDGDGKIGKATFAALNVTADERLRQIGSNLERHRWLPRSLGARYVYVNVPSYRLDAYDSGQRVLSMKVVVGAEYNGRNTPVFSDSMRTVVFRPYWNVTPSIQKTEIVPRLKTDTGFLNRNDMEFYKVGNEQFVRQRPGPLNSLGLVKFLFPNDYNIYLHDTNQKELFSKNARAASHGCVRLEKPAALAEFVLGWPKDSVRLAMQSGTNDRQVTLKKKVPVYIVYFTTYARDGQVYFGEDVYKRDSVLKTRLTPVAAPAVGLQLQKH
jgi:murein L,D-transpeptidase YcbB/YkuD